MSGPGTTDTNDLAKRVNGKVVLQTTALANRFAKTEALGVIKNYIIVLDNAVSDVLEAVKWIKRNNERYQIDTTKIIICGDSAGGGLVVNTSYCNSGLFAGCIDLWGGLPPYGIQNPTPVTRCVANSQTPPTCIIHGTLDFIVPVSVSKSLSEQLSAAGVYNELYLLEGEKHYVVKDGNRLYKIIDLILKFSDKIISSLN